MKNGLFLLASVTLSSALYAQQPLTYQDTEDVFLRYNPQLMAQSAQDDNMRNLVEQVIATFVSQQPENTLENRYTLIALARNFENSLILQAVTEQYQTTLLYAQLGNREVAEPAQENARKTLLENYARMWAVSVQVKEDLLAQYEKARKEVGKESLLTPAEQKARQARLDDTIYALRADIRQLRTNPGNQLIELTEETLTGAAEQIRGQLAALEAQSTDNLQIKTKHKKPVAE